MKADEGRCHGGDAVIEELIAALDSLPDGVMDALSLDEFLDEQPIGCFRRGEGARDAVGSVVEPEAAQHLEVIELAIHQQGVHLRAADGSGRTRLPAVELTDGTGAARRMHIEVDGAFAAEAVNLELTAGGDGERIGEQFVQRISGLNDAGALWPHSGTARS